MEGVHNTLNQRPLHVFRGSAAEEFKSMVLMLSTPSCAYRQGMRLQQLLDMDDRVVRHFVSIQFRVVLPAPAFAQGCGSYMGMGFTVTSVATAV